MSQLSSLTGSAVFHRRPGEAFPIFVRGEGCCYFDERGKQYLDLSSGLAWSSSLGQGRPELAEVLASQASRCGTHAGRAQSGHVRLGGLGGQ